jgi:hypothetical protein
MMGVEECLAMEEGACLVVEEGACLAVEGEFSVKHAGLICPSASL